jgi:fatty-acid desaturase
MDNIIAVIQAWFKDRQKNKNKKRSWKEYFKEVPKKLWRKIRWKMFILIAIVVLGFISEYVG